MRTIAEHSHPGANDAFQAQFPPKTGRAHEIMGPGAVLFAVLTAAACQGEVLWLIEGWRTDRIYPPGLAALCDPCRILLAEARNHTDLLSMAEEGLRSGAVSTVVAEPHKPLDLTAGRRLQLAAEAGGALCLLLIQEGKGSNAAETRWHCAPEFHDAGPPRVRWDLQKNKSGVISSWTLQLDEQTGRVSVASPARV